MRIAIDGKYAAVPKTGVQRYAAEIAPRLIALAPERYEVLAPGWADAGSTATGRTRQLLRWCNNVWEQGWLPLRTILGRYDLLYCPGNMAPALSDRAVVVLHDAIPLVHPYWFSNAFARWARVMLPRAAHRARWVITDSHASRVALLNLFPFLEGRLSVVYPGIGEQFRPAHPDEIAAVRARYGIQRPYLLFLSTLDPRKNLHRVLAAWRTVASQVPGAELVISGMSSEVFSGSSARARTLSGVAGVRWLGFVPDAHLPALLSGSEAMVYASLDEGFGFPPLESMACGRPAIVSTAGSLPEVCGEAALYVDPEREDSIAEGMLKALRQPDLLAPLIAPGRDRARRFTWTAAAAATDAILARVV